MQNPITTARLEKNMSPKALADRASVTLQTIYDHEHGVVAHCNDKIMRVLNNYTLAEELRAWQEFKRRQVQLTSIEGYEFKSTMHPLLEFLNIQGFSSLTEFSKELCIPRKNLLIYVNEMQGAMPRIVRIALLTSGLPVADVDRLAKLGVEFRDRKMSREAARWQKEIS